MPEGLPEPRMVIKAVDLYLRLAYPAGPPRNILSLVGTLQDGAVDFYANSNFIRNIDPTHVSYYLRLGNVRYPHAKLLIEPWLKELVYVFRVDSHDKHVMVPKDHPEFQALGELRKFNQHLAEEIELAWRAAGVPTLSECFEKKAAAMSQAASKELVVPQRHTILVVDDEVEIVKSVKNLLRPDYNVLGASGAAEAMDILKREEVHVIMTDQRMPDVTGVQMLAKIRDEYPDATRLLFTGYADMRAVIDAINEGSVYRYITKPWDPEELQTVLRDACAHYDMRIERKVLINELQKRNAELKESSELKSSFIKVASHEFRTPLAILIGLCKLALRDSKIDQSAIDHFMRIEDAAGRLERLVNQTLSMLMAEKFDGLFSPQPADLGALLNRAADDIRPFLALRNQNLDLEIGDVGTMGIDADKLRDAVDHLLFNAIKFTPDQGRITLRARRESNGITIEISDTGRGIPPECLPRLFEPFFTGFDVSRHSSGVYEYGASGLGLGLTVVKAFVQMHGGNVSVKSDVGKGTTFMVFLPEKIDPQQAAVALSAVA
jgi:signal transduction histidine kinase